MEPTNESIRRDFAFRMAEAQEAIDMKKQQIDHLMADINKLEGNIAELKKDFRRLSDPSFTYEQSLVQAYGKDTSMTEAASSERYEPSTEDERKISMLKTAKGIFPDYQFSEVKGAIDSSYKRHATMTPDEVLSLRPNRRMSILSMSEPVPLSKRFPPPPRVAHFGVANPGLGLISHEIMKPLSYDPDSDEWMRQYNRCRTREFNPEDPFKTVIREGAVMYLVFKGADPEETYKAFLCGIIDTIYPSKNLKEIAHFPAKFKQAVLEYIKRTQTEKALYFKMTSVYPDFGYAPARHLVKMGTVGSYVNPDAVQLPATPYDEDALAEQRANQMWRLCKDLEKFRPGSKFKLNYWSDTIRLYSGFGKEINEVERERLIEWSNQIALKLFKVGPKTAAIYYRDPLEDEDVAAIAEEDDKMEEGGTSVPSPSQSPVMIKWADIADEEERRYPGTPSR